MIEFAWALVFGYRCPCGCLRTRSLKRYAAHLKRCADIAQI